MDNIQANYTDIVDIAQHCDKYKLKIAETNARDYDISPIFCDIECYFEDNDVSDDDEVYRGGVIGRFTFGGLDKILALFSFARYVENSIYTDTGSGFVRKDHGNSFPVQMSEVKDIALQHRKMAKIEIERLKSYVCGKSKCSCICDGKLCDKKTPNATLLGTRSRNISRR